MKTKETGKSRFEQLAKLGFGPRAMEQSRICPHCRTLIVGDTDICPTCGAQLPRGTLLGWYSYQHPICPHCGTVLSDDVRFCPQCGREIYRRKQEG